MVLSRRIILFLTAFLLVLFLVPTCEAEGENLLENADFSQLDSDGMPEYWYTDAYYLDAGYTVFGVAEGDSTILEKESDGETTYSFYLVENAPMYLKKDLVVRGGYLTFLGDDAEERAEKAKSDLAGKTGYELLKSLSAIESDASAVVSNSISKDSVSATAVAEWLFDEEREADDIVILEEGGAYYLVVFEERLESWENSAKTNAASEDSTEWVQKLISDGGYAVSERALKKIKDVEDEAETTEETTEGE